jgi:N6-L-threonylcarbamoyladenine synthase
MYVLGIESSCDETAISVVQDGRKILSNLVASQAYLHEEFGGVVPELACRRHVDVIIPLIKKGLQEANTQLEEIDLIAVAHGPGLVGALMIGLNTAKALSLVLEKPYLCINHVEAHLYASLMSHPESVEFPCLGVILSGGHTSLLLMKNIGEYDLLGETLDDAIGEAFDKVAKMMGLPYPGGPSIEALAREGDPKAFPLKRGIIKDKPYHFSFSGLKTAVLYSLKGQNAPNQKALQLTLTEKKNMAASFQRAAFDDIMQKIQCACRNYGLYTVVFGGGVTNSKTLRQLFATRLPDIRCLWPHHSLTLDNAAMIAGLAYQKWQSNPLGDRFDREAVSRIHF